MRSAALFCDVVRKTGNRADPPWNDCPLRTPVMVRILRTWLPSVGVCLLLQASIASAGLVLNRWIVPDPPCCDSPLVL